MELKARAKINWTLDILGQRTDGYHLLEMLMQPITLADTITLTPAEDITLTVSGTPYIPPDEHHLAYRAALALREAAGFSGGAAVHVHKQIPSGAGLGGGSADAAGVLAGLNRLWDLDLPADTLERIGLTLGADVPFCLHGGLAHVSGIGEVMEDLPACPAWPLIIIQPCEGLSTGAVFKAYHACTDIERPDTVGAAAALQANDLVALAPALGNALEGVSRSMQPAIGEAIDHLLQNGAVCARMSGSGSAVFGVFDSQERAENAYETLRHLYDRTFLCSTCKESIVF